MFSSRQSREEEIRCRIDNLEFGLELAQLMLLFAATQKWSISMRDRPALAEPILSVEPRESGSSRGRDAETLLLVESRARVGGPSPPLLAWLTPRERELVLSQGRRRVLNRGQTLFNQGAPHEGIYLVE